MSHTPTDTDTLVGRLRTLPPCQAHNLEAAARIAALEAEVARLSRHANAGWHQQRYWTDRYVETAKHRDALADQLTEARAGEDELAEALTKYANPDLYRAHPHGLAFDSRDKSYIAIAALASHNKRKEGR